MRRRSTISSGRCAISCRTYGGFDEGRGSEIGSARHAASCTASPRCRPPVEHLADPRVENVTAVKKRRPPAVAVPRQRHVVAVVLHPNDDQAEARPGVEPSMYKVEFWRAALHARSREGGHEQSAAAVDVAWQGRPPSLEPSDLLA